LTEAGTREGEAPTAFTDILLELVLSVPGAVGAVFTAGDGECVDYYTLIDPFQLKIFGAHGALLLQLLEDSRLQPFRILGISGRRLSLWILPLGEHYVLTLVLDHRTWSADIEQALSEAARAIRLEADLS
jgi:hypothetical protein